MRRRLSTLLAIFLLVLPPTPADAARRRPSPGPSATASIRGTVRSGARPVPNVVVRLQGRDRSTRSNRSGRFAFKNLRPGTYTLLARTRHHGSARVSLHLEQNQSSDVVLSLRLPRPHHRSGRTATPGRTPGRAAGLRAS